MVSALCFGSAIAILVNFEGVGWLCIRMCFLVAVMILAVAAIGWATMACARILADAHENLVQRLRRNRSRSNLSGKPRAF